MRITPLWPTHRSRSARRALITVALTAALATGAAAQTVFQNPDFKYIVDIPVDWELLDAEQSNYVSFTDPQHVTVFQVLAFPGNQFATVQEIDRYITGSFGAQGDLAPFRWNGDHALFADYSFNAGEIPVRGYMTFVNRNEYDFAVMAYAVTDYYDQMHDALLSVLDGFSVDAGLRNTPGPVSQFYRPLAPVGGGDGSNRGSGTGLSGSSGGTDREPGAAAETREGTGLDGAGTGQAGDAQPVVRRLDDDRGASRSDRDLEAFDFSGPVPPEQPDSNPDQEPPPAGTLRLPSGATFELPPSVADEGTLEATQVLIEREARLLSAYAPGPNDPTRVGDGPAPPWAQAWRRYYRMIYRDNFQRLAPVAEELFMDLAKAGIPRDRMPATILTWLQRFTYERTGSLSDLLSPANCLVRFAGDCDSLGLTYAILLHHLGFDAVLMVSLEYSHAMVGVDVPGEGARFPFEGRQWLVAELTDNVRIGLIDQNMADPAGWVGIKLDPTVAW